MDLNEREFCRLRDFMYGKFGINLSEKKTLIEGRLSNTLSAKGFKSFTEFIDHLEKDKTGEDLSLVVTKLTTNFTYFYREEQHIEFMKKVALNEILPTIRDGNLNIWSAGCSSGEEPYTIAMFLDEYFQGRRTDLDKRILATDISDKVLNIAQKGVYHDDRMTRMPPNWQKAYFKHLGGDEFEVKPKIKQEIIFRKFNLMEPVFRFKRKFHIIFCRNVMIYFDANTINKLTQRFYDALMPGGYLFIGLSETLLKHHTNFEYVQPSIYRKKR
ncbi:CheR family methyltransferase [Christensenella tenuis]|uniref:protein-glutamate O-methyltransferase n=1 Tax=Christensenella tenuis TaxID=2763033 RepID=A0ABR7EAF3_9FIRM|nr:protein-glutamate O-methyltransferase CheR [Christensenella tenuis]MBC5646737.1 protein-glutamate O-methyltransferase CheR [Christensenella tenuis]